MRGIVDDFARRPAGPQFSGEESALLDGVAELFREIFPRHFESWKAAVQAGANRLHLAAVEAVGRVETAIARITGQRADDGFRPDSD